MAKKFHSNQQKYYNRLYYPDFSLEEIYFRTKVVTDVACYPNNLIDKTIIKYAS